MDNKAASSAQNASVSVAFDTKLGHRKRMRKRIALSGAGSLADYELLEVLLFAAIPRRDTKPQAKALLAEFSSLAGVLEADRQALRTSGATEKMVEWLSLPTLVAKHLATPVTQKPILFVAPSDVEKYVEEQASIYGSNFGSYHVLLLNTRNELIHEEWAEVESVADLCHWVLHRSLIFHAASLLLLYLAPEEEMPISVLHRHVQWGGELQKMLKLFEISLHDYIIHSKGTYRYLLGHVV